MSSSERDVREFLVSRRVRITPDRAGLPVFGDNRRVPGLRREEVALLAGVSVDYYNRLERGNLHGVSDKVLQSIAAALQLDEAERSHLLNLARVANDSATVRRPRTRRADRVRPSLHRLLDAITDAPALIRNSYFDYLAANRLGRALLAPVFDGPANAARFTFLDPSARDFYVEWDRTAAELVAAMRGEAGRNPYDRRLSDLVGELSTRSDDFRTLWGAHDVRFHRTGVKRMLHPVVGVLELDYEILDIPADPGLIIAAYTAGAGTDSSDKLRLLASWAATQATVDHPAAVDTDT